jgi:perosamine synthetase
MDIRQKMLPVLQPKGDQTDIDAVKEIIESGWWGKGPKVEQFEQEFAQLVGSKYAIAVTSNSHGQDLIMKALGIKNRDVVNPTISFMATAMIPLWNDCTTNVVDVDPYNMCIDPDDVRKHLTPKSDLLIAVNQAGVPAPIDDIRKFYDGYIIEDCAHSCYTPGVGLKGDSAVWSFQAVKTMPSGDGGMITLNDEKLYHKLKEMTWFGVSSTFSRVNKNDKVTGRPGYTWDYEVDKIGYKCYMIDLTAALCLSQLKKLPSMLEWRRHVQTRYNNELCEHIIRPPFSDTVQYYCAKVPHNHRDKLIDYLFDSRVLHIIKENISGKDTPGVRYNVYSIDYGCYVDLLNTKNAPKGLFEAAEDEDDTEIYIDVPKTDYRAIRRAILDLDEFYKQNII